MKFTESQRRAIQHRDGYLHLIACAGSGKTEVLANRIANLLDPDGKQRIEPRNIVAFTFTEKAAGEIKSRIAARCKDRYGDLLGMAEMFVGTIHAFCLDLLKTEVPEYLKFEVLNEVQQHLLVDRNSKRSGLTTTTDLGGQPLRRYVDTGRYVQALSILREADADPKRLRGSSIYDGLLAYEALLAEKRYFDYTSILSLTVREIERDKGLQVRLQERIRHVIVDEYQDVNPVQERLVRLLARLGASVCVVGDDDQTIYQWRGSDVRQMLSFPSRYKPTRQIKLQENFRSSKGIVETAREFISQNEDRLAKEMIATDAQPYTPGDICALGLDDPEQEAAFIVETIESLRGVAFKDPDGTQRGLSYADMAILLRSVRNNGEAIAAALKEAGIPYIVGGMNNLFDNAEAEAARQLFYYLASRPDATRGVLESAWKAADLGLSPASLKAAVDDADKLRRGIAEQGGEARWSVYNLQRAFIRFLELVQIREEAVPQNRGEVVFYNLGRFSQVISDFESIHFHSEPKSKYEEFGNFLFYRADAAYPEGSPSSAHAAVDAVQVMTIHQAKGMQWPVVFLPALLQNRFPAPRMGGRTAWHLIPAGSVGDQDRYLGSLEDERRLFYVAMTRSQRFLFMTWAPIEGKNNRYRKPSMFWEDVLSSKFVKRRSPDFSSRPRKAPKARTTVANVTMSFSELKYFFECPFEFKLRVLYGFNAPIDEALGFGKSLHDALAEVHSRATRGDIAKEAEAARLVDTHLHVPYAYPALRDKLRSSARQVVENYLKDNRAELPRVEFAEKTVEIDLGDGVTVAGRIDLVRRKDTGATTIVDLKSTSRAQAEHLTEAQLHVYALGYRELTGRDADYVEVYELDDRKRKQRSVDDDFIKSVVRDVRRAAAALRTNDLPASPMKDACPRCDFLGLCSRGQCGNSKRPAGTSKKPREARPTRSR